MRRKDREMPEEFALRVVDECAYAVLALKSDGEYPYAVPISIVRNGEDIYFHCALQGLKTDLLNRDPHVRLVCVGGISVPERRFTLEYASAILSGSASEVLDAEEKTEALRLLCLRHAPANMAAFEAAVAKSLSRTAIWKVHIDAITGKRKKYGADGVEMRCPPLAPEHDAAFSAEVKDLPART